jgi:ABC-type transport system involved in multi-copper enzyme maturation permease subunit
LLILRAPQFLQRLFIDPLSVKELSGIARRWQTYLGRGLYVGLIGLIVWIFWMNLRRGQDWMSPSAYAELGRNLFYSFFALQMVVVTFGGMSAASDMITRELRGGTLGLLALTPLTPWRIVAGKWKASMLQTSSAILCGGPVFAICVYLRGVGPWEFAYSLTLSLISAALAAAVALYCSTIFRAGYVVTIVSFIALAIYCIAPVVLFAATKGDQEMMTFMAYVHPLYAAIGAAVPRTFASADWSYGWISASLTTAVIIFVLLKGSASRVRLLIRRPGGAAPPTPSLSDLRREPGVAGPRTSKLGRFLRGRQGVWERNAILWKELSTRRVGVGNAARLGGALLVFALLTTMPSEGWWRVLVLWFSCFVLVLVALANGVSLFVTEREERKWDVLLTTPLRASEIVSAKLLAGLSGLAPMAMIMAFFWVLMGFAFGVSPLSALMTAVSLGLLILLSYVVSAFMSLSARNQRAAFSASFGILVALLFVLPAVAFMFESYRLFFHRGEFAEVFVACTNPGTYLAHVSEPLARSYRWEGWHETWRSRELELLPSFLIYTGIYASVIVGLVLLMVRRFDRSAGRS